MFRLPTFSAVLGIVATCLVVLADEPAKTSAELQPKRVSLPDKIPLGKALKAITQQTGIEVTAEDEVDLRFPAKLEQVPFWQAIDAVAKAADMRLRLYQLDGKLGLVKNQRGWREVPTSYSGLFRVVLKRITMTNDLEDDVRFGVANLEVAWEPRFQAFLLATNPTDLVVEAGGVPLKLPPIPKVRAAAHDRHAMEINLPVPAVRRQLGQLDRVQGTLTMIGSPQMLHLTFDTIKQGEKKVVEGVTVALTTVQMNKKVWVIDVSLTYPPDMFGFESFQSWLVNNECWLEKDKQKLAYGTFESDNPSGQRAVIRYRFAETDELKLNDPAGWKLVYRTPAKITEVAIPFEFKDVPLP